MAVCTAPIAWTLLHLGLLHLGPVPAVLLGAGLFGRRQLFGVAVEAFGQRIDQSLLHRLGGAVRQPCPATGRRFHRSLPQLRLPLHQPFGHLHHRLGHAADCGDLAVGPTGKLREAAGQLLLNSPVHPLQQDGFRAIDEEVDEHQQHRHRQGQRRRVEFQTQAGQHGLHGLVEVVFVDAVQGHGDADDGSQKAHNGDRPDDDAEKREGGLGASDVHVGEVLQFVVQAVGPPAPPDIVNGREESADVVAVLRLPGDLQTLDQFLAMRFERLPRASAGAKRRLAQPGHLTDDVRKPQQQRRQADGEHDGFDVFDGVLGEIALDKGGAQRTGVD